MVRLFRLGLAVLLPLTLVAAVHAGDKKAGDDKEFKVEGKLADNDPKDKMRTNSPHKVHVHAMKANTIYVIDLKSTDFDSFLRLETADGKQLAFDDDGGGFPNARLIYKMPKDDKYRIIVTSFDGKAGDYVLTVRQGTEADLPKAKEDPSAKLIGKPAPDISGEFTHNGKAKKLSDLKGKVVLVDFWAVWCGPCIATFPHLRDWNKEFQKEGLEILGVTTYYEKVGFDKNEGKTKILDQNMSVEEEQAMLKDFATHHKLAHQLLAVSKDEWKKVGGAYGIRGIPTAVLVDRQGVIRMVRVGSGPENAQALEEEIRKLLKEKN